MTDRDTLLSEIDTYRKRKSMAETSFGRLAVNDGHFLRRLRGGGNVTLRTVERVRAFMGAEPAAAQAQQEAA